MVKLDIKTMQKFYKDSIKIIAKQKIVKIQILKKWQMKQEKMI